MKDNLLQKDLNYILDNTGDLWKELKGARIFITGGTGFWGLWLLESFVWATEHLKLNAEAVVLTRDPITLKTKAPHLLDHPAISFYVGDVRNYVYPKENFDYIIHAATDVVRKNTAEQMLDTIIRGTEHTLKFATLCGAKKVLLASSGAVYGKIPADMKCIPEDYQGEIDLNAPNGLYGLGKRVAEKIACEYADKNNFEVKIARGFACLGPYMQLDAHFAIGNFILNGLRGEPIHVLGDGTAYRSYLYAADLAIWLWTILFKGKTAYPYNVGSDDEISIMDLANIVADSFDLRFDVVFDKQPQKVNTAEYYVPLTKRANEELNLFPKINLSQALKSTIDWCLSKRVLL